MNPRARCQPVPHPADARLAWDVVIDANAQPQNPPAELGLAKISRGAAFEFAQRRDVRR